MLAYLSNDYDRFVVTRAGVSVVHQDPRMLQESKASFAGHAAGHPFPLHPQQEKCRLKSTSSAFGLALPSHSLAATLLASDGIKIKEAFPIFLQQRIERQRVQRAVRRYDQGLDPSEAILQGRYQLVIGKPPQCWQ